MSVLTTVLQLLGSKSPRHPTVGLPLDPDGGILILSISIYPHADSLHNPSHYSYSVALSMGRKMCVFT